MNQRLRQFFALAVDYAFISICLLVILVAGGASYFLHQSVVELEHEHAFIRLDGESMMKAIAGAAALRTDRSAIEAASREISANLITEENLADNLGYFYKIEDQSHARISELHQLGTSPGNSGVSVKTVPFSVNVTGTFAEVSSFLHQLEHGPRLMRITAFNFDRRAPTGDAVVLELNLDMLARP